MTCVVPKRNVVDAVVAATAPPHGTAVHETIIEDVAGQTRIG